MRLWGQCQSPSAFRARSVLMLWDHACSQAPGAPGLLGSRCFRRVAGVLLPPGLKKRGLSDLPLPRSGQPLVQSTRKAGSFWTSEHRARPRLPLSCPSGPRSLRGLAFLYPRLLRDCSLFWCISQPCCVTNLHPCRGLKQHLLLSRFLGVGSPHGAHGLTRLYSNSQLGPSEAWDVFWVLVVDGIPFLVGC